ncbi:MAG: hypothetical protein HY321_02215 [Armatimonadetes bacterium]|nr:hypothetical protein [Armatimonadota bacterium]
MAETATEEYIAGRRRAPACGGSCQAFWTLRSGYTLAPVLAGLDKFRHLLVDWDQYLAPQMRERMSDRGRRFMRAVGVIEVAAGLLTAVKPRIGGYVVGGWLIGIIGNLLLSGKYRDIALRDLGLALGAFSLARLAEERDERS